MADTHGEVIHEHHHEGSDNSGMGWLVGLILVIVLAWLLFYYGVPLLRAPANPQINVPGQIDVNVNTPNQGGNPAQ